MALQELLKNKLRTFLSLFGITIGIFCIISVLATVGSLERNIQNDIKSLGNNTLFLDKWDYSAGGGVDDRLVGAGPHGHFPLVDQCHDSEGRFVRP